LKGHCPGFITTATVHGSLLEGYCPEFSSGGILFRFYIWRDIVQVLRLEGYCPDIVSGGVSPRVLHQKGYCPELSSEGSSRAAHDAVLAPCVRCPDVLAWQQEIR
jgi:hypothetical protein